MIELENVSKWFGKHCALSSISLSFPASERTVLLGPSGAGKSTLLRLVAGLEAPDAGRVNNSELLSASSAKRSRSIALLSQDYALYPQLTVLKNLQTALKQQGLSRASAQDRIESTLEWFGISDLSDRMPNELSGGEAQRAAFAKALVTRPKLLLLDEPLSQVDNIRKEPLTDLIVNVAEEFQLSTIVVTHDPVEAMRLGSRIIVLVDGKIADDGKATEVYRAPKTRTVGSLLSAYGMNWFSHQQSKLFPLPHDLSAEFVEAGNRFWGFRPEDFIVESASHSLDQNHFLPVTGQVEQVQPLGFGQLVVCICNGQRLRLLLPKRTDTPSDTISGFVPIDQICWTKE